MEREAVYLTLIEAAKYLGISRSKLSVMVKEGDLKPTRSTFDKRVKLFRKEDLDVFLSQPKPSRQTSRVKAEAPIPFQEINLGIKEEIEDWARKRNLAPDDIELALSIVGKGSGKGPKDASERFRQHLYRTRG